MAFKMKYKNLKEVVSQLKGAVKAHGKQAEVIQGHIDEMEDSPYNKERKKVVKKGTKPIKRKETKMIVRERNVDESVFTKAKGTNVSWKYGGKTYHGTLIPSKETATHRYARTHNGKIKSLPKNK